MMRVSDEQFKKAVAGNPTIAGVLRAIGYSHQSSGYRMVHREVQRLQLDTSHWHGQRHWKGQQFPTRTPTQQMLVRGYRGGNKRLKARLLKEGLLKERCAICNSPPLWKGKPLSLHLDHIDGNPTNYELPNLRLLCPNCHSQTSTFGTRVRKVYHCGCGVPVCREGSKCRKCAAKGRHKIQWPAMKDLRKQVKRTSKAAVARSLGVSFNALKKHLAGD